MAAGKDEVLLDVLRRYRQLNLHGSLGLNDYGGEALYCMVKLLKPEVVVETGVSAGVSTAYILRAMHAIDRGRLYSVDLPGEVESGILVPSFLRTRWDLSLGRSRDLLRAIVGGVGEVDIFIHDSDHSYENMMFEFETTWPVIVRGGLLVSDDTDTNSAWNEFAARQHVESVELFAHAMAAIRKS